MRKKFICVKHHLCFFYSSENIFCLQRQQKISSSQHEEQKNEGFALCQQEREEKQKQKQKQKQTRLLSRPQLRKKIR
jgi:hypothetical protein